MEKEEIKKLTGPNGEKIFIQLVTKQDAEAYLRKNERNRRIKERTVEKYVRDMNGGNWFFNGSPILISNDNELLDGQHRLAAIVKSGIPQNMIIIEGVSREALKTIDLGYPRTQSDALRMLGIDNSKLLSTVAKKTLSQINKVSTKNITYSVEELYSELVESSRIDYYKEAANFSKAIFSQYRMFPVATIGMMYVVLRYYKYSQEEISDFFDQLIEKKESCNTIRNLRKRVKPDADRKLSVEERERLLIRTFNEYSNGNDNYYVYNIRNKKSKTFICQKS